MEDTHDGHCFGPMAVNYQVRCPRHDEFSCAWGSAEPLEFGIDKQQFCGCHDSFGHPLSGRPLITLNMDANCLEICQSEWSPLQPQC